MNATAQTAATGEGPAHVHHPVGSRWYFYEIPAGGWQWDHVDASGAILARAAHPFRSRTDCVLDAKRRGYAPDAAS